MSLIKRILRYYLYSRRGLTHIGVAFSLFNFINIFYLVSREWELFEHLKYSHLIIFALTLILPILTVLGFLDFKKGYFAIESSIATEQNPYSVNTFTEKEKQYLLPITIASMRLSIKSMRLNLKTTPQVLKKLGIEDAEISSLIDELPSHIVLLEKHLGFLESQLKEQKKT